MRIEKELPNAVNAASQDPHGRPRVIYEKVNELALEPFVAPDPLRPIYDDEIQLVCWMAIFVYSNCEYLRTYKASSWSEKSRMGAEMVTTNEINFEDFHSQWAVEFFGAGNRS